MKAVNADLSCRRHSYEGRRNKEAQVEEKVLFFVVLMWYIYLLVFLDWERFSMFTLMDKCKWKGMEEIRVRGAQDSAEILEPNL